MESLNSHSPTTLLGPLSYDALYTSVEQSTSDCPLTRPRQSNELVHSRLLGRDCDKPTFPPPFVHCSSMRGSPTHEFIPRVCLSICPSIDASICVFTSSIDGLIQAVASGQEDMLGGFGNMNQVCWCRQSGSQSVSQSVSSACSFSSTSLFL